MSNLAVGDVVKVEMPRGKNARGVEGIHTMYATSQEGKCDGAIGTITDVQAEGPYGIAVYKVDFTKNENKWMPPYTAYWFRQDFIKKQ